MLGHSRSTYTHDTAEDFSENGEPVQPSPWSVKCSDIFWHKKQRIKSKSLSLLGIQRELLQLAALESLFKKEKEPTAVFLNKMSPWYCFFGSTPLKRKTGKKALHYFFFQLVTAHVLHTTPFLDCGKVVCTVLPSRWLFKQQHNTVCVHKLFPSTGQVKLQNTETETWTSTGNCHSTVSASKRRIFWGSLCWSFQDVLGHM